MRLVKWVSAVFVFVLLNLLAVSPVASENGDEGFQVPLPLLGFPVIAVVAKMTNFVKKLMYSLNPQTYFGRRRKRSIVWGPADISSVERHLVSAFGRDVCVFESVCDDYARRGTPKDNTTKNGEHSEEFDIISQDMPRVDWDTVIQKYRHLPEKKRQFYILSVILGDIGGSTKLCNRLAKKGRACK